MRLLQIIAAAHRQEWAAVVTVVAVAAVTRWAAAIAAETVAAAVVDHRHLARIHRAVDRRRARSGWSRPRTFHSSSFSWGHAHVCSQEVSFAPALSQSQNVQFVQQC
jgi:hypothetical protein